MDSTDPLSSDQQQQGEQAQAQQQQDSGSGSGSPTSSRFPRPIMQSMPDNRQQSFDEIYGPPENFLEIEVCLSVISVPFSQD